MSRSLDRSRIVFVGGLCVAACDGGTGTPDLVLDHSSVNVGEVELGAQAVAEVTLRNRGSGPAQIERVEIATPVVTPLADGCTGTLGPAQSCTVSLAVRPPRGGALVADVTLVTSAGDLVAQIAATGRAWVTVEVRGAGVVTSEPAGIRCGADAPACTASFVVPEIVLRVSEDVTVRWAGACAGPGDCALVLDRPIAVTATTFEPLVVLVDEDPTRWGAGWGVAIDPDDRMIVTGEGPGPLTGVAWTSAFDPDGRIVWTDRHDPGREGHDAGHAVDVGSDGSIVVAGQWYSSSWTRYNAFVRKLGPGGERIWSHDYDEETIGDDGWRGIAIDHPSEAMYVAGYRPDPSEIVPALHVQGAIRRLDPGGQLLWERTWQGSPDGDDVALDVAVDLAGNAIVVGRMATASHGSDAWIAAYARDGALLWSDQRGTVGDDAAVAVAVAVAPDGSFAVVGSQAGVAWIARYDADRQRLSELSSSQVATWQGAVFAASGDLVVTGGEQTGRYTAELAPVWTRSYRDLRANDVAIDHAGNVVVVGSVADDIALIKYGQ